MNTNNQKTSSTSVTRRWPIIVLGVLVALNGLALAAGGVRLATLGGSWYYLITGVLLVAAGVQFVRLRISGFWLCALVFLGTVLWSLYEVGFDFWQSVPRLAPVLVMSMFALLALPSLSQGRLRKAGFAGAAAMAVVIVAGGAAMFVPHAVIDGVAKAADGPAPIEQGESRWQYYGRTPNGTRYAPFAQINKDNVAQLDVAWTFRTGEIAGVGSENQNTPTQIGDTVYVCTPRNKVFALDADTGEQKWVFDPQADNKFWNRCRGVGFYEPAAVAARVGDSPASMPSPDGSCNQRIVLATVDSRLIQLDAKTGKLCAGFGKGGTVDLNQGMGPVNPRYYFQTSAPTVVRNLIVVGGFVADGREIDEPSGVVRAFSADTGELVWAWDLGNPNITKLPPEGQTYTRSTPNVWSTPSFDEKLGLIYLPTGNQTPDFLGTTRLKDSEAYSSAIVALDFTTGKERWKFQTVHHDLWDYDVPAQPALYDVPDGKGGTVPALIQVTKRGQIFMLDRRTGTPLAEVKELPAPQGAQKGEWLAKTQPYSVGMPAIGAEPLSEASMWGATWFDQMACRIQFKKLRYDGDFTPTTTDASLIYPGYAGGMNWGSVSIDEHNSLLIVNDLRIAHQVQLIPRAEADQRIAGSSHGVGLQPQKGSPFATDQRGFTSPLGIPCNAPAWGTFTAIDLKTRKIVWQRPAGTTRDVNLNGTKVGLPVPLGMPTLGGPMTTSGGLTFYAGTQDYYLRAFDTLSGKELWKGRLPVGTQATPMTYVSPKSNQQFVVVTAGGSRQSPDRGDYVVAYKLKDH